MFRIPVETLAYWQAREGDFKKATPEAVAGIMALGKGALPRDYLEFIATYGFPEWEYTVPDSFDARTEADGQITVDERAISHLWSFESLSEKTKNIWRKDNPQNGFPMLPDNMFPVGGTPGQDLVVVEMEPEKGRIWYWRFTNDAWGTPGNRTLGFVANSFTDFINNLRMGQDA
jgi:hypothetical protein